jgi:hypothetical protein
MNASELTIPPLNQLTSVALERDGVDEKTSKSWYNLYILPLHAVSENQANRYRLQEKVWVLGTRTPALGGNVRPIELRSSGGSCQ